MPKIIIDEREIACRDGAPVLQAAIEAGWDVPHYCYHPGLSVVASCRLCLMEMKLPHPKTHEMDWAPKLFPSCQTPVRDGMEVRFDSDKVRVNQRNCMEFFLIDHPLDCPVCDQAGECYLQDYSRDFGNATSRMVEQKHVNPKKNIGSKTLLYQDRCVMCTRCVRFTREVTGTRELCVVNRGHHDEIDVFPGEPLENKLQGNVVDLCPVGALLDKDFLFAQRVWYLSRTPSVCPGCSTGCTIDIDHNEGRIHRVKPRYNPEVNDWWICDDGRFGWKYVHDMDRLTTPRVRRGDRVEPIAWKDLPGLLSFRFAQVAGDDQGRQVAVVLSPMMSCEEAWLLIRFMREVASRSTLVLGPVPVAGNDECFPAGATNGDTRFTIRSEKCPNRRGIEHLIEQAGGRTERFDDFVERCAAGEVAGVWITGGYPTDWTTKELTAALAKPELLVVQDLVETALTEHAEVVIPSCMFAERDGTFMNHAGLLQAFERAVPPPAGVQRDGQILFAAAGFEGLYSGRRVREMMAEEMPAFAEVYAPPALPEHQH
jgi:NADH-quinone oxidoreductase subunit G